MGGIRRIKRAMNKQVCMAKTGVRFEGCEVVLVVNNPAMAKEKSERFRMYLNHTGHRSSLVNIGDILGGMAVIKDRRARGEPICN